jgi:hypothetical protein
MVKTDSDRFAYAIIMLCIITLFLSFILTAKEFQYSYAVCKDGTISYSEGSGVCSWHGGIEKKVYNELKKEMSFKEIGGSLLMSIILGIPLGIIVIIGIGLMRNS